MAELGITFLLFLMGLEFDFNNLKYLGKDIFISTTIQSIIFFSIAFALASLLGFTSTQSIYLAIIFMFSSTLLVAKWIEDKKETSTLHGKIILGILIVQDLFAILILTVLNLLQETNILGIIYVVVTYNPNRDKLIDISRPASMRVASTEEKELASSLVEQDENDEEIKEEEIVEGGQPTADEFNEK